LVTTWRDRRLVGDLRAVADDVLEGEAFERVVDQQLADGAAVGRRFALEHEFHRCVPVPGDPANPCVTRTHDNRAPRRPQGFYDVFAAAPCAGAAHAPASP